MLMRTPWKLCRWMLCGLLLLCAAAPSRADDVLDPAQATTKEGENIAWYDVKLLGTEGQGWTDTSSQFDRLPSKAEKMVRPPVWSLSHDSAGIAVRFKTSAPAIFARWTLTKPNLAMPHMPATGVSGLDLYVRTENGWQWLNNIQSKAVDNQAPLIQNLPPEAREYLLYLPLYNGVKSLALGVTPDQRLAKGTPRAADQDKPVLFYGTSITQGGCASRPGMVHTAILGRWLDRPVINLGFSGNGRMEPEMADLLSELDPSVYVLDCLPNMGAAEVAERVVPFVHKLREKHPETPIVLVEDRSYSNSYLVKSSRERNETSRAALRKCYETLQSEGVKHLHYLEGKNLLGADAEGTVDSSHPTDLGFWRQAEAMQPVLKSVLK